MDLRRQRRRVALYRFNLRERDWVVRWPGPYDEPAGDVERAPWKASDGTVDFACVPPREPAPRLELDEVLTFVEAVKQIRALYERSSEAQSLEADPLPKKKEVLIEVPAIPQDAPRTVYAERTGGLAGSKKVGRKKTRGWTATDPAWRATLGVGKTRWEASHSLRVQIAAVAWRRMGGRIGGVGCPLPCVLRKLGKVWAAFSWKSATFGVGLTVEEALTSLVRARGEQPRVKLPAVEWRDDGVLLERQELQELQVRR